MKNDSHIKLGWQTLVAKRRGKVEFSENMSSLLLDVMYKNGNKMSSHKNFVCILGHKKAIIICS